MTRITEEIVRIIDSIPPVERAALIEELFCSFDRERQRKIDAKWAVEAESRIDAYEQGKIPAQDAAAVFDRINQR